MGEERTHFQPKTIPPEEAIKMWGLGMKKNSGVGWGSYLPGKTTHRQTAKRLMWGEGKLLSPLQQFPLLKEDMVRCPKGAQGQHERNAKTEGISRL